MIEQVQEVTSSSFDFLNILFSIFLGSFGGLVKTIQESKEDKSKFTAFRLLGNICMSGFTALMVGFLLQDVSMSEGLKTFLIGVSGWSGTGMLSLARTVIETYLVGKAGAAAQSCDHNNKD